MSTNDFIFYLTDSSDSESSLSDHSGASSRSDSCDSEAPGREISHWALRDAYGSREKKKIVHRRFVAPAAIRQHTELEHFRDYGTEHERILHAARSDARFDQVLGRPVFADDQPCCCQHCQPLSPRSTTPMQGLDIEQQPEQTGLYCTNTSHSGISPRPLPSSPQTISRHSSGSTQSHSCSMDSNEFYVPSGRNLSPIEKAIDPLECEIVDASFWVWRWSPDKEEDTLSERSTDMDLSGVTSSMPTATSSRRSTCGYCEVDKRSIEEAPPV